jgi:hypothetical protein
MGVASMRIEGSPLAGLCRAVAEHIEQRLKSNADADAAGTTLLKSDQFQSFVSRGEAALNEILGPGEVSMLESHRRGSPAAEPTHHR